MGLIALGDAKAVLLAWSAAYPCDEALCSALELALSGDLDAAGKAASKALFRAADDYAATMDRAKVETLWRASCAAEVVLSATAEPFDHDEYKAALDAVIFGPTKGAPNDGTTDGA